jgi:glycosyltransferase involved in cell wall biosynthesis
MKILHVCHNYYPSNGGPQYTMKHVSEKLVQYYSDEVEVATTDSYFNPESPFYKKIRPAFEIINNVKIHRYPFHRWHYPFIKTGNKLFAKFTGKSLPFPLLKKMRGLDCPAITKSLKNSEVDVVMATTIPYNFADYPLWRFQTKKPKPFVLYGAIHLQNDFPYQHPFLQRARACDCYIANTEFEKRYLINKGVQAHKIISIGTGIEPEDFLIDENEICLFKRAHGIKDIDKIVGYVGKLSEGKGVAVLVDAIKKIAEKDKHVKLLLAGAATSFSTKLQNEITAKNLPVILLEDFDHAMKSAIYNTIDVFVSASQGESFGVVFLEAWACKKPVIAANMGATASLLSEGKDSFLFDVKDTDQLINKIEILINDISLRQKLGRSGHHKLIENFTWPVIIEKYRLAYLTGIENFKRQKNS